MRNPLLLIAALCLSLLAYPHAPAASAAQDKPADKPIRALLITGGCCHDYTAQRELITKGVSARAKVEWTVLQEGDKREHKHSVYANPEWSKGFDVIVHNECFGMVDDDAFVESIVKAHATGLPAVALHCSMHSYRAANTTAWAEMLGIKSNAHGPKQPIAVTYTDKSHPITQGLADWTTPPDELYNNVKVYDTAKRLATGKQGGGEAVVAWTNDYRGTRVFCTTLGHGNDTVGDDRYLELVTRGLLWSVGKLETRQARAAN